MHFSTAPSLNRIQQEKRKPEKTEVSILKDRMQCLFARRSLTKAWFWENKQFVPLIAEIILVDFYLFIGYWWNLKNTKPHFSSCSCNTFCIFQMSHRFQMRPFISNISNSFMEYLHHHHALSIFPLFFPNRNINQEVSFKIWNTVPLKGRIIFHSNISLLRDGLNGLRIYFFIWNLCPRCTAMPLIK